MMVGEKLRGKHILFFSVQTFNIEREILDKLKELGAIVRYYDERPANNNFTKGIIRLKRKLYQSRIDNYYLNILEQEGKKKFDYLFVNRGEVVPPFFLEEFRKLNENCQFIFYTWDSFLNHSHPISILKYFDRKLTFDPGDSIKYGLNFRPLFYLDAFKKDFEPPTDYDLLFLGTAHSDRYRVSSEIYNWTLANHLRMFRYYYMHGRFVYLYKRLFDPSFKQFDYRQLSFKSLNKNDILALYQKSKVVLDINHPHQRGLTMRTFEAIAAQKKLITTNSEIKKYPFYNPNNILIIDRNDISLNVDFFATNYESINKEVYNKLSIEGWLYNIFFDEEITFWNSCR